MSRRTLRLSLFASALALSLTAFGHLVEDYLTGDAIVRWDVTFARWLHAHADHPLVRFFDVVTLAGNSAVLIAVVAVVAVLYLRGTRANDAVVLVVALGGAALVNALLKLAFQRPRPELAFIHLETYSFPSGHAAVSAATFTTLAYLTARRRASLVVRVAIGAAATAAIAFVGFSRLYLGAHYLSDVLAGAAFGLSWAFACLLGYTYWEERDALNALPPRVRQIVLR